MKNIILIATFLISFSNYAQLKLQFNEESELKLNELVLNNKTTFESIITQLGEPVLKKESKSGVKLYIYKDLGIALKTYNDKLTMIGANFNWDGDKNFPEKSFSGDFYIGSTKITKESTKAFFDTVSFLTFDKLMMEMYAAKTDENVIMLAFNSDGFVTQIGFEFKPE